jgi:single-stranded DNA-binding protein
MNKFTGVGTLPRNAVVHGSNRKVLRFTLATVVGHNRKKEKDILSYVPCVVFRPSEAIISLLAEDAQGLMIGVEGRVNTSRYESNGKTKYSTEVVVNEDNIQLLEATIGSGSDIEKVA